MLQGTSLKILHGMLQKMLLLRQLILHILSAHSHHSSNKHNSPNYNVIAFPQFPQNHSSLYLSHLTNVLCAKKVSRGDDKKCFRFTERIQFFCLKLNLTHLTFEVGVVVGPFTTSVVILSAFPIPSFTSHLKKLFVTK